jgi:hypothetical protein
VQIGVFGDDRPGHSVDFEPHSSDGIRVRVGTIRRGVRLTHFNGRSNVGCRSRWMERDPVGELVSERGRAWAKDWRIEHSEFAAQITVRRAKLRSYRLLLDAAEREFRAKRGDEGGFAAGLYERIPG